MNAQPNEIITHILSYLDNYTLMFARGVCHKWKHLIETRIFYKSNIPELHVCLLDQDYYHFGKYHLNHNYDTKKICVGSVQINDIIYYNNLVEVITEKNIINKIFHNIIPRKNVSRSIERLLIYASYQGHLEIVKYLISIGADFHAENDFAFRWSAYNGHLKVVKYLISIGADLHANNDGALRCSAERGHLEVVKYLISIGADLHAKNDDALRWSAEKGHLEIIKYLISIGADLHADNDFALRCSAQYGYLEIVKYLISVGADLHVYCDEALQYSAENGHLEIVKYLISMGADLHVGNDTVLRCSPPNVVKFIKSISRKN